MKTIVVLITLLVSFHGCASKIGSGSEKSKEQKIAEQVALELYRGNIVVSDVTFMGKETIVQFRGDSAAHGLRKLVLSKYYQR